MAQFTLDPTNFSGTLHFVVEEDGEEPTKQKMEFQNFPELFKRLEQYFSRQYDKLFPFTTGGFTVIEFEGISFSGREGAERFSVDCFDGWKRATFMMEEAKYCAENKEKLQKIKEILNS